MRDERGAFAPETHRERAARRTIAGKRLAESGHPAPGSARASGTASPGDGAAEAGLRRGDPTGERTPRR